MEILAAVSEIVSGGIDYVLSRVRIGAVNRVAATCFRRASGWWSALVFQIHWNHGDVWVFPQLEYLNSSVLVTVFETGVGVGIRSAASCLAGTT